MEPFYLIVLAIAIIVLILLLTFIGLLMNKKNSKDIFPPIANTCPDEWIYDASANACLFNENNLGYDSGGIANAANTVADRIFKDIPNQTYNVANVVKGLKIDPKDGKAIWAANGLTSTCAQKSWANRNGILWDGVSNYNSC